MEKLFINGEYAYRYVHNPNYYVTKTGKVYSVYKKGCHGETDYNNPHMLSYGTDKDGYYRVVLSIRSKKRYVKVHTIVVEQFIGDIPKGMVVNHKDGNVKNNNVFNLEIVTVKENTIHAHNNNLTSTEKPVDVEYNFEIYHFKSKKDCIEKFPDITQYYLSQIEKNIISFSAVLFQKVDSTKKISPIIAYHNGKPLKRFNNMIEADQYFGKKKGTVSGTFNNCEYRKRVNKYTISFPNVSTIESVA